MVSNGVWRVVVVTVMFAGCARGGVKPGPPPTAETVAGQCAPRRFDLLRFAEACDPPPELPGGTWTFEPLFPDAPMGARERMCSYTWTPTSPGCAPPPTEAILVASGERLVDRGDCPLDDIGCAPTVVHDCDPAPAPPASEATTFQPTNSNIGCCDACAQIRDARAYVVITDNVRYKEVYFDAARSDGSVHRVTVPSPATNVIEVALDDDDFRPGLVPQVHMLPR